VQTPHLIHQIFTMNPVQYTHISGTPLVCLVYHCAQHSKSYNTGCHSMKCIHKSQGYITTNNLWFCSALIQSDISPTIRHVSIFLYFLFRHSGSLIMENIESIAMLFNETTFSLQLLMILKSIVFISLCTSITPPSKPFTWSTNVAFNISRFIKMY